jgi:hypothetical protein
MGYVRERWPERFGEIVDDDAAVARAGGGGE